MLNDVIAEFLSSREEKELSHNFISRTRLHIFADGEIRLMSLKQRTLV